MIPLRGGRGEIEVPTSYLFKLARTDGEEKEGGEERGRKEREREKRKLRFAQEKEKNIIKRN